MKLAEYEFFAGELRKQGAEHRKSMTQKQARVHLFIEDAILRCLDVFFDSGADEPSKERVGK